MVLPKYFFDYFTETFMIPSYTCDKYEATYLGASYPGYTDPYVCYCNSGDFHTMPIINIEIANEKDPFKYDVEPAFYMYRPFLTSQVSPATYCMFGVESQADGTDLTDKQVTLGQRALATFPYFAVFDRNNAGAYWQVGKQSATGSADAQVF